MSKPPLTYERFMTDPKLLGGMEIYRQQASWASWLAVDKACYGESLTAAEQRIFCELTQRRSYRPPPGGWPEIVIITGRQSGKTRSAGRHVAFAGARAKRDAHGERHGIGISQDQRASMRTLLTYIKQPFQEVPMLQQLVAETTQVTVKLTNGLTIVAYPCKLEAPRGLRASVVVLDELAFYRSSENLPLDKELIRAVRPCLATVPGSKLIIISSPYGQFGALHDLHARYFAKDDADEVLVVQATAPQLNPLLPPDYLERMRVDDPEAAAAEIDGQFRAGLSLLLDPRVIDQAVDEAVVVRPPQRGCDYQAGFDASGGRADAAALGIAHREPDGSVVLDALQVWPAPHSPESVIGEASRVLRHYGLRSCAGDRYAGQFVTDAFRRENVGYKPSDFDRSQIFLDFAALLNSGKARLLDSPQLVRELRGLERRRGLTRDKVDHRPGAHDDAAVAAGLSLTRAAKEPVLNIGVARMEFWM